MQTPGSVTRWSAGLHSPDLRTREEAARQIWERYSPRLAGLVRRRLAAQIRRREDENDVLQGMFHSFYRLRRAADTPLASRDDLWRLLVRITLCKVANTANFHRAACRDVNREVHLSTGGSDDDRFPGWMLEAMEDRGPTAEQAEEVERLLHGLPDNLRQIVLWAVEGLTNKQIAARLGRCERTVELKRQQIRGRLGRLIPDEFGR
jgi:DNA-directed RNA polymerase specialized sigma24 family protein